MPKAIAIDDEMVRGRGRKRRAAPTPERGGWVARLLRNPKDKIAGVVAFAAVTGIVVNALMLQAGRHPSPMFDTAPVAPAAPPQRAVSAPPPADASPLPRPRPVEVRPAEMTKPDDPMAALVRSTSLPPAAAPPRPEIGLGSNASQRVAAVQRALTDYGYGQLKPTGTIGADTQAAIQRFERERKLPITGQMSERLVRELGLATGKPIP